MQVAGPYDLLGGIRRLLPKTLPILEGESVTIEWDLDELPVTAPAAARTNPRGIFRILSPIQPRNAVAADANEPYRLENVSQADAFTFATGILSYEVTQQDVASIESITGTVGSVSGHTFVAGMDYTFTQKTVEWTGTGALPDNGTIFTVAYKHRMYYPRTAMDSRATIRATLKCQAFKSVGNKPYAMSTLAAVLGSALEMNLRARSAAGITRPGNPDELYTETMTLGRVISSGPLPMDASGSLASWFVDFTVNIAGIHEAAPVQSIRHVPFEVDVVQ